MGKAIVISDADFSTANLGSVTPKATIPLTGITIVGSSSVYNSDNTAIYTATYTPAGTTQVGVSWLISRGAEYAVINRVTGVLTILQSAIGGAEVTIRAQSTYNPAIFSEKVVQVSYFDVSVRRINIIGDAAINNISNLGHYSIEYTPAETTQVGVSWQSSDPTIASVDSNGNVSVLSSGSIILSATSLFNQSVVATKQISCVYNEVLTGGYIDFASQSSIVNLVKPSAKIGSTEIEIKAKVRTAKSFYFGCRNSARTIRALMLLRDKLQVQYGTINVEDSSLASLRDGLFHIYILGSTFTIDGTAYGGTNTSTDDFPEMLSIPYNTGGTPYDMPSGYGVEYIKITENGVITHNFVAAQVGNDSGFLDTITSDFISTTSKGGTYSS